MVTRANAARGGRNRIRTGIALSATGVCAADIRLRSDRGHAWRAALEPPNGDAGWPSLANALADLARTMGVNAGTLAVALMPPLIEVRRLDLPPLRDDELHRLLTRNASRYFVNARGPQVLGASRLGGRKRGGPAPVMAAAASAKLVTAIHAAAEQSGWTIETIAPAETSWAAGSRTLWPGFSRGEAYVIVAHEDRTDLLQLDNGELSGVRRFRAGAADGAMIADTLGPTARVGIAGASTERRELSGSLEHFGVRAVGPGGEAAANADCGDALAAQFAGERGGPVLRSENTAARDGARSTTVAWTLAGLAAALLLISAGLELWGVKRQLRNVRDERAALRGQIAATLVGRTTLDATYRQVAALAAIERTAPRWSAVIANLSEAVPQAAYLTAIRTRQDSLVIDGLGEHAAQVFDALSTSRGLVDVRSAAPVRREVQADGRALEHFTIAARVQAPSERPSTASPASNRRPARPSP